MPEQETFPNNEPNNSSHSTEDNIERLTEMILDHLGLPRPGTAKHLQMVQDELLPAFMDANRLAWLAASPMADTNSPIFKCLHDLAKSTNSKIETLDQIFEQLGVHDLLRDLAASDLVNMLHIDPLEDYETRLLKAAGHPKAIISTAELLSRAAQNPDNLASPSRTLTDSAKIIIQVQGDINVYATPNATLPETKPRRRRFFGGLGKVFGGLVRSGSNILLVPTLYVMPAIAPQIVVAVSGSLAAGIQEIGEGVGQLRQEGE